MAKKKTKKSKKPAVMKAAKAAINATSESNGFGIMSVVLGICSLVFAGIWFAGLLLGMLGIISSLMQARIKRNNMQKAGLMLSILGLIFVIIISIIRFQRGMI